jgi:hypothetical protein
MKREERNTLMKFTDRSIYMQTLQAAQDVGLDLEAASEAAEQAVRTGPKDLSGRETIASRNYLSTTTAQRKELELAITTAKEVERAVQSELALTQPHRGGGGGRNNWRNTPRGGAPTVTQQLRDHAREAKKQVEAAEQALADHLAEVAETARKLVKWQIELLEAELELPVKAKLQRGAARTVEIGAGKFYSGSYVLSWSAHIPSPCDGGCALLLIKVSNGARGEVQTIEHTILYAEASDKDRYMLLTVDDVVDTVFKCDMTSFMFWCSGKDAKRGEKQKSMTVSRCTAKQLLPRPHCYHVKPELVHAVLAQE